MPSSFNTAIPFLTSSFLGEPMSGQDSCEPFVARSTCVVFQTLNGGKYLRWIYPLLQMISDLNKPQFFSSPFHTFAMFLVESEQHRQS